MFVTLKKLGLVGVLFAFSFLLNVQNGFAQPYVCLPTCSEIDNHFFRVAGINSDTLNNADHIFLVTSPGSEAMLEFGIFDGDSEGFWDTVSLPAELEVALLADPLDDGTGMTVLGTWSSDGTFGNNVGNPMPDNDWFDIVIPLSPLAMNAEGNFSYIIRVSNLTPNMAGGNAFKVRASDTGTLVIPANAPFNINAYYNWYDTVVTYPNTQHDVFDFPPFGLVNIIPEACLLSFCDITDPGCCLFGSPYDGTFIFYFEVPEGTTTIGMADGDLDFGSSIPVAPFTCAADGVDVDMDDLNTPNDVIPPWAIGTTAVFEGVSTPTSPLEDNCNFNLVRSPSVFYRLVDPNGVEHVNTNPSGTEEWEFFSITTNPFNPLLYDLEVDEIPAGVWRFDVIGLDIQNLASFRFPFALSSVNPQENGNGSTPIPTLGEWGLVALSAFVLIASVYYLRRKKSYN